MDINLGANFTNVVDNFNVTSTGNGSVTLGANLTVTNTTTVSSGALLKCATAILNGGTFTLNSGGQLGIGSASGLATSGATGNIQNTNRNFSTGANYVYTGTAAQNTGTGLPATVNSLTDNNTSGTLTLAQGTTITGSVTLASGANLSLPSGTSSAALLSLGGVGKSAGTWGSTTSGAAHQNNTYFAGSGVLTITTGQPSVFTGLTASPAIAYGTTGIILAGKVSAAGPVYPASGENITITINGTLQTTTVNDGTGDFSFSYNPATIPYSATAYTIAYGFTGDTNLNAVTNTSTALTVNKAALGITANNDTKTYGQTKTYGAGAPAFTSSGLQNGETIGSVTLTASGGTATTDGTNNYTLVPSAAAGGTFVAGNYTLTYTNGTLTVNPLAASLTGSRAYDGTTNAAATILSVANAVGGDSITVASGTAGLAGKTPGAQALTVVGTLTLGGTRATNYTLLGTSGSVTITAATVTPVVTLNNKTYDGTTNAATIATRTLTGIIGSDDVNLGTSGTVAGFSSKNVGSYSGISLTGLTLSGTTAGNYSLTTSTTNASASITARSLSVTAAGVNKPYDGTTNATVTLSDNKVSGDVITDNYTSAGFSDKNAGSGKTVTVSGISISGTDLGNYSLASTTTSTLANITAGVTSIGVASALNPSGYKASVNFSASLPTDATGNVVFLTNSVPFSTNAVAVGSATSLSITNLPRGTNTLTVQYAGDSNYFGSTNTLAGGQIVTNHPPVAGNVILTRSLTSARISISTLGTNVSDVDGDALTFSAGSTSTNGVAVINATSLLGYYNTNGVNDQFTYTVTDGFGGIATGTITLNFIPFITGQQGSVSVSAGVAQLAFLGIPNFRYAIQRTTNLVDWVSIEITNAPSAGAFKYADNFSDLGGIAPSSAYYRLQWNP